MTERITLVSDEVEDFILEFKIDADATFYDLHRLILASCQYEEDPLNRFCLCDDNWEPERIIGFPEAESIYAEEEVCLMKETRLADFLEDEKQRFTYLFDSRNERSFFMELTEIIFGAQQEEPVCSRRHGKAPLQNPDVSALSLSPDSEKLPEEFDGVFYEEETWGEEDFDPEGFEIQSEYTPE